MVDTHAAMQTFAKVVELGSFAAAAERLDLARSAVTRQIAFLEQKYGVRLLNRTTRKLSLTDAGRAFQERIQPILAEMSELELTLQEKGQRPSGLLRVSAPFTFGILHLGPAISAYMEQYPDVAIDLELSDRTVDLVEEGFDLALRLGTPADSSLVARPLSEQRMRLCAAPAYLARHGTPRHPDDLRQHECLNYHYASQGRDWQFEKDGQVHSVRVDGKLRANNGDVLRAAAVAGRGVILQPGFIVDADIEAGRLVPLLADYGTRGVRVQAVYPHRRFLSPKVRTFVRHLEALFGAGNAAVKPAARRPRPGPAA
ncbi:Transcriptional regulator, LysR family [plant metagenome]|uniref:Transcriptional regulator, LysR family n=1 Tax=plant metagenome TaxID=1297885 RepID=A0A484TI65_9ZZZZ